MTAPTDPTQLAEGLPELPATGPYVGRIVRIFKDMPHDDSSALVLLDYARAAIAAATPPAALDVGALSGLVEKWRRRGDEIRGAGVVGVSGHVYLCANELATILAQHPSQEPGNE